MEDFDRSSTAARLTDLIGRGQVSVAAAAEIAGCVVRDHDVPNAALQAFASLGTDGKHPSNAERDLHRWLKNLYGLKIQSYTIHVPLQAPQTNVATSCFTLRLEERLK